MSAVLLWLATGLAAGAVVARWGAVLQSRRYGERRSSGLRRCLARCAIAVATQLVLLPVQIATLDDASRPEEHALTGLLDVGYTPLALGIAAGPR